MKHIFFFACETREQKASITHRRNDHRDRKICLKTSFVFINTLRCSYIPPLHLKLGLMKNFVNVTDQNGAGFYYLLTKFPGIASEVKGKTGVFNGIQFGLALDNQDFVRFLTKQLRAACGKLRIMKNLQLLCDRCSDVGCHPKYISLILIWTSYRILARSVKNMGKGTINKEIATVETRYYGRLNPIIVGNYCWILQRDSSFSCKHKSKVQKEF